MMFSKPLSLVALLAVAAFAAIAAKPAQAATPKANAYIAWIETQSVIYMVNQEYGYEDARFEMAYEANVASQLAFLELLDVEKNVRGASLEAARDYLDDAAFQLYMLNDEPLTRNIRDKVKSAIRYNTWARNGVQKQLGD